ncbi:hypothetical protein EYC84_001171 [Monilinia fructicola]|uniref:Uncharacterized protein n=1 Tax=Monilinia fructicola TaxID=38448 RepID=A0A5M9JME7_MONFR|nr:hypothetical protein EYC84_001171 [Monilinia fructicola]
MVQVPGLAKGRSVLGYQGWEMGYRSSDGGFGWIMNGQRRSNFVPEIWLRIGIKEGQWCVLVAFGLGSPLD